MAVNDTEKLGWREKVEVELKTIVSAKVQQTSLHRLRRQAHFDHKLSPFRHFVSEKNYTKKEILDEYKPGVYWSDFVSLLLCL